MSIVWIKNNHSETLTYDGQDILVGEYYNIQDVELASWRSNNTLLQDIANTKAIVASSDTGSNDVTDISSALDLLKGSQVEVKNFPLSQENEALEVTPRKPSGSSTVVVTHDWTDKCTWYSQSTRVEDEVLTNSGDDLTFNSVNTNWIDLSHGRVYNEDNIISQGPYTVEVTVDDVIQSTGFTVNYENGTITFDSSKAANTIKASYSYAGGSCWVIKPDSGKKIFLEHAEIQFSKNTIMASPIDFEIWVYNPNDLPNKMLYQKITYKNVRDIISSANLGQGVIPAFDTLTHDVLVFPFNYVTTKTLKDGDGAELRLKVHDDDPFTGGFATVSFYISSKDE